MIAEWIDTSVRNPDNWECVFMKHKAGKIHGWYNPKDGWCYNGKLLIDIEITHWLELKDEG